MNYWLHRISHHAEISYPLLDNGFLTIGFSDFIGDDVIDIAAKNDWHSFEKVVEATWSTKPRTRYNLWRFLRMTKGDIVIVPSWGSFYVCEVSSDKPLKINDAYSNDLTTWRGSQVITDGKYLLKENGNRYDLGFALRVRVLYEKISREKFADAKLTSRMKVRQTNSLINDLKGSIEKSITNYEQNKPIHLHSIVIEKLASQTLETIKAELTPSKFEKLIKVYFRSVGADTVTIPPKNERGKEGDADIVAVFEKLKLIIYVQAKFQKDKISEWGVNQIVDYKTDKEATDDGYNKVAWLVTTADTFSQEAEKIASENEVQLIDGIEFSKMLLNSGLANLNREL